MKRVVARNNSFNARVNAVTSNTCFKPTRRFREGVKRRKKKRKENNNNIAHGEGVPAAATRAAKKG